MTNQDETTAADSLDLTCEVCPMTFVRAKLRLDRIAVGEVLEITLKEGEQMRSVPMSLKAEGHKIEAVRREGDRYFLLVRKGE